MTPGLVRDRRGAVYVEFLIAFMPVFCMFLGLVQLADLHQANLIVNHAAIMAARSAAVVLPDDPQFYDNAPVNHFEGKRREAIVKAGMIPLLASRSLTAVRVTLPSGPGGNDSVTNVERDTLVRVAVQAQFECRVPLVKHLLCDSQKSVRVLRAEAAFPNQGADYRY